MSQSQILVTFQKLAALFLEFESDFLGVSQESQSSYTIDLQKDEFKILWEKVRIAYETFATSNAVNVAEEESEDAKQLYKECRLAYITIAAQLGELSQTFGNKAVLSSTRCVTNTAPAHNSMGNRVQNYQIKLPPCTA